MKSKYLWLGFVILLSADMSGCKKNIDHINNYVDCPVTYSFHAPYEKIWHTTIEAVMELTAIDTMDQKSGYISTDIAAVDGREMDFLDHALFGQTYKYTYDIRLGPEGSKNTRVNTKVKLYQEQFMGISRREESDAQVEDYLREKLYRTICNKLFPNGNGHCSGGFSGQTARYRQPPVVAPASQKPAPAHPPARFSQKVQSAQKALQSVGYSPGPADGLMGQKTKKALGEFQQDSGLAETGILDDETYGLLEAISFQPPDQEETLSPPEHEIPDEPEQQPPKKGKPVSPPLPEVPAQPVNKAPGKYTTSGNAELLQEEDLFGAEIIGTVPAGTTLHIISHNGDYYKVKYKGKEGFIHYEFVREQ